jgi:5-hydroxyisourate hydrolase
VSLTTHVLDIVRGCGAAGMKVAVAGPHGTLEAVLDDTGRAVLLPELVAGSYEILFHAGAYQGDDGFYDVIPVRFNVTDPALHYHVPLVLSAFGYSTYRGG